MDKTQYNRLIEEKEDLKNKITKLNNFIETDSFANLDVTQRLLITAQLNHMLEYLSALSLRIERIEEKYGC